MRSAIIKVVIIKLKCPWKSIPVVNSAPNGKMYDPAVNKTTQQ